MHGRLTRSPSYGAQQGTSLVEVLVSMLVIAFGVLAMAAVQSNATRHHKTSEFRSIATQLANDLADRIRANGTGAIANRYAWQTSQFTALTESTLGSYTSCGTIDSSGALVACSAADMASRDLYEWKLRLVRSLPNVSGYIGAYDAADNAVEVWVAWVESDQTDRSGNTVSSTSPECPPTSGSGAIWSSTGSGVPPVYQCIHMRISP